MFFKDPKGFTPSKVSFLFFHYYMQFKRLNQEKGKNMDNFVFLRRDKS